MEVGGYGGGGVMEVVVMVLKGTEVVVMDVGVMEVRVVEAGGERMGRWA